MAPAAGPPPRLAARRRLALAAPARPLPPSALAELQEAARSPSSERWDEVVGPLLGALLDPSVETCPEVHDDELAALALLRTRLAAWPPGLRPARSEWLARALRGAPVPALAWADSLQLYRLRGAGLVAEDPAHAAALLARGARIRLAIQRTEP